MNFLQRLFGGRKRKTPPQSPAPSPRKPYQRSRPDFPEGDNYVDDPDVRTVEDLQRYYPLPEGFVYRVRPDGVPYVERLSDGYRFTFLIEAGMLTMDEPYTKPDGSTAYHTIEVIKRA